MRSRCQHWELGQRKGRSLGVLLAIVLFELACQAATLVLPDEAQNQPGFGALGLLSGESGRWQQIYYSEKLQPWMPNGALITGVSLRNDDLALEGNDATIEKVEVVMSTTADRGSSLSPVFAFNYGPDRATVYSQSDVRWVLRQVPNGISPFDAVIPFPSPYLYDPSKGNLLVELRLLHVSPGLHLDAHRRQAGPDGEALIFQAGGSPDEILVADDVNHGVGLVMRLSFDPIPEPISTFSLVLGLFVLFLHRRARGDRNNLSS